MATDKPPLDEPKLRQLIDSGHIDTVLVVFTDMQGRLAGKRIHAKHFVDEVLGHGTEACNYLLAVDVEMNTVAGYDISSWQTGYGDFKLKPDLATLRPAPWLPSTAMVQCDLLWMDDNPVLQSPRQILRAQVARAEAMGYSALAGTELEFIVFEDSYEEAWNGGYRSMTPSNRYNVDYSILGGSRVEPLLRDIRNAMYNAGLTVESAKGECNLGQHEIAFKYDHVLRTADQHSVYKTAAKELAARHGKSLTFMAKYDEREGNSCHIHMSLRGPDGIDPVFSTTGPGGVPAWSTVFTHFLGGVLNTLIDFTLLYAPNVNSYKRFQPDSFAPTAVAWGLDNRTCALRVVGTGSGLRVENRLPGGDVNPYLALAGMLGGGLYGIEHQLQPGAGLIGNAYSLPSATIPTRAQEMAERGLAPGGIQIWPLSVLGAEVYRVPSTLQEARDLFAASPIADAVFGPDVVKHYVHAADIELAAHAGVVSDWERFRGFERL